MEVSFTSTEDRIADGESESMDRPVERLESVASIIEPSFPRDEELIYEGDVDNDEGDEPLSQVDMEVEEEEEKDELIVDFTAGELDLDPKPFERERTTASTTPSQPSLSSNDKSVDSKFGASKVDTEESSKERFVSVFLFLYMSNGKLNLKRFDNHHFSDVYCPIVFWHAFNYLQGSIRICVLHGLSFLSIFVLQICHQLQL